MISSINKLKISPIYLALLFDKIKLLLKLLVFVGQFLNVNIDLSLLVFVELGFLLQFGDLTLLRLNLIALIQNFRLYVIDKSIFSGPFILMVLPLLFYQLFVNVDAVVVYSTAHLPSTRPCPLNLGLFSHEILYLRVCEVS